MKKLTVLDIAGIAHIKAATIETDRLALRLLGPGSISFVSLIAGLLEVNLTGGCQVNLKGKVAEQKIAIGAMGIYNAPDLESKKAVARLRGPGKVTVWVTEDLDVTISGPGSLEYYGAPKVKRNIVKSGHKCLTSNIIRLLSFKKTRKAQNLSVQGVQNGIRATRMGKQ